MLLRQLFEAETSTYTYLLADEATREAVLIDAVRETYDRDTQLIDELGLKLTHVLDTHVHADHVTSAGMLRERYGLKTCVSAAGGALCADVLLRDGDTVRFGRYLLQARATPGHTDGCMTYVVADEGVAFTGDALLIRGCGRTDFQQGDSRKLYRSVHEQIFSLPDETRIYPGHDYKGRTMTTVGEEKAFNPRLGAGKSEDDFVSIMAGLKLAYPRKIDEAVPANLKCGLPEARVVQVASDAEWAPSQRAPSGVPEVSPAWVAETFRRGAYRLIDVREADELIGVLRAIPDVEHVPLATIAKAAAGWDKKTHIVIVCRSGNRSGRAALELEALGFHHVVSMAGGMLAWEGPRT